MAYFDTTWYIGSAHYAAVTVRPQNTAVAAGVVRRQFTAPAVGSERCFVCVVAGTTANVTDATWTPTRGAVTTDGTVTWRECTGSSAMNGDLANTPTWSAVKAAGLPTIGTIIRRNNSASYHMVTSGTGTLGASEPAFSDIAGTTVIDSSTTWTSLGPVGNFPAWGAPHARLANAYASTWGAAGHKFWIADNHAETQTGAMTLSNPATVAGGPCHTICVDRTAALPPVEANYNTGATITTIGASLITVQFASTGSAWYQGLAFFCGDSGSASLSFVGAASTFNCKNCAFVLGSAGASLSFNVGGTTTTPTQVVWDNCTVKFGATSHGIALRSANFEWRNTPSAIQGATIPAVLFSTSPANALSFVCRGVDLSAFPGQLLANGPINPAPLIFEDCKFHASMTRYGTSTSAGYASTPVVTVRCDSGATNYKSTRDEYAGSQTTETSITRVGGATDGTTPSSIKIVTNSQAAFLTPYRMLRLAAWNDVTGTNRTVTVCGTVNAGSLPLNDEIWMDVQYLGSSSSPIASFKTTCKSHPLAAGAAVASDGSTWNTPFTTLNGLLQNVTLSNGNLTATHATGLGGAASSFYLYGGKYYFEATVQSHTTNSNAIGIIVSTGSITDAANSGSTSTCCEVVLGSNSTVFTNGASTGKLLGAAAVGDVFCVAIDLTARLAWFRRNAGNWNGDAAANPATGTGGVAIIAGAFAPVVGFVSGATTDAVTFNFGQSTYAQTSPTGFFSWDTGWSPFKLVATLTSPQPQMKGYVYASIRAAKPSTTLYIDPQITLG